MRHAAPNGGGVSPTLLIHSSLYKTLFVVYKTTVDNEIGALIEAQLEERTAAGIARTIGVLITSHHLSTGDKMPTVRGLASQLGVSVNTVSDAWRILQNHGMIATDRRRGTTVRARRATDAGRYWQVPVAPGTIELDLSTGTPDRDLLPPLGPVLHRLHADVAVTSYVDPPLLQELEDELRRRWPFDPAAITVVDGAQDALDRTVQQLVSFGDTVVVEEPTFPPLLDMLDLVGAIVIGVPLDADGPRRVPLAAAMKADPVALFIQPRAHNPTGAHISAARVHEMADLVAGTRTVVVEDDHSGAATGVAIESVGEHLPEQVLHIRSFSKSHGPDLRIAALGGPADLIGDIVRRRSLGPAWTSRLIQHILHAMLTDPDTDALIDRAAAIYQRRRAELGTALTKHGLDPVPGVGLNMWIPVEDEQRAVVALAAHGVGVAPGAPFRLEANGEQHIRLSVGALRGDLDDLAATIAAAAHSPRSSRGRRRPRAAS